MRPAESVAVHPVLAAMARAPVGAPFTAEQRAAALEGMYRTEHGE